MIDPEVVKSALKGGPVDENSTASFTILLRRLITPSA
jgi:hypothetical protein